MSNNSYSIDDIVSFSQEMLANLEDSQDSYEKINLFLTKNQDSLRDIQLIEIFPIVAEQFIAQNHQQQINRAIMLVNFSHLIRQFPLGLRWLKQEIAIISCQIALGVITKVFYPEQWAGTQCSLANAYRERSRGDQDENIEQAIDIYHEVLTVCTRIAFSNQWAVTKHNLANALRDRIRGNRRKNIERSISIYKEILEVYKRETLPDKWAMTQNNLANAYRERIQGIKSKNIEQAIGIYKEVLEVYTRIESPENWAMTQHNLAAAYYDRIQDNRADNIEQSISMYQEVIEVYTQHEFPWDWAMTKHNLAAAYYNRIYGDRSDNLECSITAYEESLQVYTKAESLQDWAMTQNALGNTYADLMRGNRSENIEIAIRAYKQALKVRTRKMFPSDWAMTKNNLASTYRDRIEGDRADNVEKAIQIYKQSLQIYTLKAFPEQWAMTQNNLANAYRDRIREDRGGNIGQAIDIYKKVLKQVYNKLEFPSDWAMTNYNLAAAHYDLIQLNLADDIKPVIDCCKASLEIYQPKLFPHDCRRTARMLGNIYFKQKNWLEATKVYALTLSAAETIYQSCDFLDSKATELAETPDLYHRAAYAYAKNGDLEKAVLTIEIGRARGLRDSLERDRSDLLQLAQTAPELEAQYKNIAQQLRTLESQQRQSPTLAQLQSIAPADLRNGVRDLSTKFTQTVERIRQHSGYETFLLPPAFEDICAVAKLNQPIVYLITTTNGSLALIMMPQEILPVWIDDFTRANLQDLDRSWFDAYDNKNRPTWEKEIDRVTRSLWQVMEPIIDRLQQHNLQQAILIPTAKFSLLPLHAAWRESPTTISKRHYALDSICFSYAPNALSIKESRSIADRITPDRLLAINEPTHQGVNPLLNSDREVASAIAAFPNNPIVLRHQAATRSTTLTALADTHIWHCSCHGKANLKTPLDSGLNMAGTGIEAILTLRDILELQLTKGATGGIRLAVLSACESGLTGFNNIDEAISLPNGLLQAGVAGVIASLWSVSDLSTMILISRFYTLWRTEDVEPSIALNKAQRWLRDANPDDIVNHCATFVPDLDRQRGLKRSLLLNYSAPYHWAAFSYTGS